jgi:hypothetical protein
MMPPVPGNGACAPCSGGYFGGFIGVAAIAVWAFNVQVLFGPAKDGNFLGWVLRILLLDAVTIVILVGVWRALVTNQSADGMLRAILRGMVPNLGARSNERRDGGFSPFRD